MPSQVNQESTKRSPLETCSMPTNGRRGIGSTVSLTEMRARETITQLGGRFFGTDEQESNGNELLDRLQSGFLTPEIPREFSLEFLSSKHPLRDGTVGSKVCLYYDVETNTWLGLDLGGGGADDLVPGSMGKSAIDQLKLLNDNRGNPYRVADVEIGPASEGHSIMRLLGNLAERHLQ